MGADNYRAKNIKDSEGRITSFVDAEDERSLLRLHEIKKE